MSAPELVASLKAKEAQDLPIIVFSGGDLSREEETALHRLAEQLVLKRVKTLDRLLDETALFYTAWRQICPRPANNCCSSRGRTMFYWLEAGS